MAELFQTTPQNVTLHLRALYQESEIDEAATCKDYLRSDNRPAGVSRAVLRSLREIERKRRQRIASDLSVSPTDDFDLRVVVGNS